MPVNNQLKNQHLLWRAGFGPAVEQLKELSSYSPEQYYKALVKTSSREPKFLDMSDPYLRSFYNESEESIKRKELSPEERRSVQRLNREGIRNLNLAWLTEMVHTGSQLREKLAFFWHGHFACRNLNLFFQQDLLHVIRKNSLGNFGTLLREVSRSAAMLNFLNNQQNRKGHPNENFAREVMELFTMGRGNYTENDIKEAARAFTGWAANRKGEFIFRKAQHDNGNKTILGRTGKWDGDDVLNILLEQKQTARYITRKILGFFVNDAPDEDRVNSLADKFQKDNYEIAPLLEEIFTSDWFYSEKYIGSRIKSPVELIVGIQRMVPMRLEKQESLLLLQRILGQVLFYPPNVAGWAGGKTWIDSSTLMMRMRLPQLFNDEDELNVTPKSDDDQMMGKKDDGTPAVPPKTAMKRKSPGMKLINADLEWKDYNAFFEKTSREKLLDSISATLLQVPHRLPDNMIKGYTDERSRESFIRTATIQLMSTPEYQLC